MIYTTYFAQLRNLPQEITPVSICAKAPNWYTGKQYKRFAPKYEMLMRYKENHDSDQYTQSYYHDILNTINVQEVLSDLREIAPSGDIALVCFEKATDFCHRHLVREWLVANGIECTEYSKPKEENQ